MSRYDYEKYPFQNDKIFKVPCGMHVRDQLWIYHVTQIGSLYYMGKKYDIETGNPAVGAPMDKCQSCELAIFMMQGHRHNITQCEARLTDEPIDFENSLNKVKMDWEIAFYAERDRLFGDDWYCMCIRQERDKMCSQVRYRRMPPLWNEWVPARLLYRSQKA